MGSDFYSTGVYPYGYGKEIKLPSRLPDGTKINWQNDGTRIESNQPLDIPSELDPSINIKGFLEKYADNDVALKNQNEYSLDEYPLIITGNKAHEGAGVASNGNLVMGEDKDISLAIQKYWQDVDGDPIYDDLPESVTVEVYNYGKKIDEVVLNDDNYWQTTLEGLPFDGDYTVKEVGESSEGYTVSCEYRDGTYSQEKMTSITPTEGTLEYFVDITNTKQPTEGSLTINKNLTGSIYKMGDGNGRGSVTTVFHIVGTRPAEVEGEESVVIYDNYVGMDFTEAGSESVTLEHLPLGAYTVTEVIPPNSGFTTSEETEIIQSGTLGIVVDANGVSSFNEDLEFSFTNVTTDTESPSEGSVNRYTFVADEDGAVKTIYKRIVNNFNILQQETN